MANMTDIVDIGSECDPGQKFTSVRVPFASLTSFLFSDDNKLD